MIYHHTEFHLHGFNGLLVTVVKLEAKENFRTAAMLYFILQNILV
jgi:hypothetical protein